MKRYGGIDLHSNNSVVVLQDEEDWVIYQRRILNDLVTVFEALELHRKEVASLAVESTPFLCLPGPLPSLYH